MTPFHISLSDAIDQLNKQNASVPFTIMVKHGQMQVEYFKPDKVDTQTPHTQDEVYIICGGSGWFKREGDTVKVKTGDILFVPAGMEHHFFNFTNDFATWVIFYGPEKENGK